MSGPHRAAASGSGASLTTALVALASNLVVAAARLVAGLLTGSATLLAESAHGLADSANELLLALSIRAAKRPPSAEHPFGYQGQRFLWAFVAAVLTFVLGGLVSLGLGVQELLGGDHDRSGPLIGFIVIAISFVADGISFGRGVQQARQLAESSGVPLLRLIARTSDPIVRAVVVEDAIALLGDVVATFGLGLRTLTGSDLPDAIGAITVGVILCVAAVVLAQLLGGLLLGRGLPPRLLDAIRRAIEHDPSVRHVLSVSAIYLGPAAALVVAKVVPRPDLSSEEIGSRFSAIDQAVREAVPIVVDVYLDPTDHDRPPDDPDRPDVSAISPALVLPDD